ncbi:MAG: DUF2924 domain-containing protein [Sinimarinibacterium flocculans]|uniref:DUF2924 domain-containing protein n=1 Tax=Sinimarinibacterium flocculans TaxID=985250 RepID=UPI003C64C47E
MVPDDLERRLATLPGLPRSELLQQFEKAYGRAPPLRLSNATLALAIGYRWQEQVHGGLKPEIRKMLLSGKIAPAPARASAGTVLIREWQGREHTVIVRPEGVEYSGQRFRSLTEVAFRITGQKRSGPAFFGLRK